MRILEETYFNFIAWKEVEKCFIGLLFKDLRIQKQVKVLIT